MPDASFVSPNAVISQMFNERTTYDLDGAERRVTGGISRQEADFIREIIETRKLRHCLETGVAHGVSTVVICEALSKLSNEGLDCRHWGADPCQMSEHGGTALAALRRCGLDHLFELLDGPSELMLPRLIEREESVGFAFIDGWHTFDNTLIDVFFADALLNSGGILVMHDMQMPSKQKVANYLLTHRKYKRIPAPMRSLTRRILSCGKNTLLHGPRRGWVNLTQPLMFVAEKTSDFKPNYDFFRNF